MVVERDRKSDNNGHNKVWRSVPVLFAASTLFLCLVWCNREKVATKQPRPLQTDKSTNHTNTIDQTETNSENSSIFSLLGTCVEQPLSVKWTLFINRKPWSAGQIVCEMMGGYLASFDTPHKMNLFVHLLNHSPWNSSLNGGAYTGLSNQVVDSAGWSWVRDCSRSMLDRVRKNDSCISLGPERWYSSPCTYNNEYLCETPEGSCTYEELNDTIVEDGVNYTLSTSQSGKKECEELCNDEGVDCWAVAFVTETHACRTYQTSSPFFFDDRSKLKKEIGSTLYIKRCYKVSLNTAKLELIQYETVSPASPCSSDQSGRVYILVTKAATAQRARDHCLAMKYKLAGSNATSDRIQMADIINNLYKEKAQLSDDRLWVDVQASPANTDKRFLSASDALYSTWNEEHDRSCGLLGLDTGLLSKDDCKNEHRFLCETSKPCTYIVRKATCNGTSKKSEDTEEQCVDYCYKQKTHDGNCTACSFDSKTSECTLYSSISTNTKYEEKCNLYCWSCVHVVLQQEDFSQEIETNGKDIITDDMNMLSTTGGEGGINTLGIITGPTSGGTNTPGTTTEVAKTHRTSAGSTNTPDATTTTTTSTTGGAIPFGTTTGSTITLGTTKGGIITLSSTTGGTNTPDATPASQGQLATESTSSTGTKSGQSATDDINSSTTKASQASSPTTATEATPSRQPVHDHSERPSTGSTVKKPFYCSCQFVSKLVTSKRTVADIVKELTVVRNATYASRLRYISVNDRRPSSQSMGAVAVALLGVLLAVIFINDCISFISLACVI